MNEINHPEGFGSGYDVVDKGSDLVGGAHKDAHYLALLLNLKLTYAVVDFDHFGRFDKHRLARGALVVDNTESLRLCIGATGITRRPSRMVGEASASTTPSAAARAITLLITALTVPDMLWSLWRMSARRGLALSRISA